MKPHVIRKVSAINSGRSLGIFIPAAFKPFLGWVNGRTNVKITLDGKRLIIEETNERNTSRARKGSYC